jgi:hypothetical protein
VKRSAVFKYVAGFPPASPPTTSNEPSASSTSACWIRQSSISGPSLQVPDATSNTTGVLYSTAVSCPPVSIANPLSKVVSRWR